MSTNLCPGCQSGDLWVFFEIAQSPVLCTVLCPTREAALRVPRGPIRLACCQECGLISNVAFDERLLRYTGAWENSLHFSRRFQQYAEESARRLIDRYELRGKDLIEIGCGQGDFLSLLCALGPNRGVGFDPSFEPTKAATAVSANVTIVPEVYSDTHADCPADLICCRHVFEHLAQPLEFLHGIRRAIGPRVGTIVFFEVPCARYMLQRSAVWDVIYAHCSYFTPSSLRRIFIKAGFEPLETRHTFDDQFLTLEARPGGNSYEAKRPLREQPEADLIRLLERFPSAYQAKVAFWQRQIAAIRRNNLRAVIWGAGSKGVSFLNALAISDELLPYVVDVNPRKHGHYVVGTAQEIVPPSFLPRYRPQIIILMNAIYRAEVEHLSRELGIESQLLVVH
jgi:SAM-dependent methyltransferase